MVGAAGHEYATRQGMRFSALILAGSRAGEEGTDAFGGASHKALIQLEGQSLLERVATALREAGAESIAVSCNESAVTGCARGLGLKVLPPAAGPSGSVLSALDELGTPLLVTTADHALLRAEWVREIIDGTPERADLGVMLANRHAVEQAMPGSKRTYLRFADGNWSGCNLFFLRNTRAREAIVLWQKIESDRKRPLRIVWRLGVGTLLRYLLGRLTLQQALSRLGANIGVQPMLVSASDGLAAVDVDKPEDLADIQALLKRQQK